LQPLGRLYVLDYYDCDKELLDDPVRLEAVMLEAAKVMGATIKGSRFDIFEPHGVSGVVTIGESHLALHSWPEYGFAMIDFSTCGTQLRPWDAHRYLREALGAKRESTTMLQRGFMDIGGGSLPHKPPAV
jgi:S-adenosylmethionine decarboxylase